MDMKALALKLGKIQNKGSKGNWFKPNEEDQTVRILPYPHQKANDSFLEVYFHYDIAGHRSICCPKKTLGNPCPICDLADEFLNMGGRDNWEIFKDIQAKLRTYSPVIVRGKEEEGVKLWGFGKMIYESLMETCIEEGDITDIADGHDLAVKQIPVGAPGNDSTYPKPICKVQFKQSPALGNKKKLADLIKGIPNYLEDESTFKFMEYNALLAVVEKLNDEGQSTTPSTGPTDEGLTFGNETPTPTQTPPVDSANLQGQLDDLLNS